MRTVRPIQIYPQSAVKESRPVLSTFFLSHGSPMTAIIDTPAHRFLANFARRTARPSAILVASAHWESTHPVLTAGPQNVAIHDFYGFPKALSEIRYQAPGAPGVAEEMAADLGARGFAVDLDRKRGLDHGAWVPLRLAYPAADVPVIELSVQPALGPEHHLALGRALAPWRERGVLILGSGSFTHDLRRFSHGAPRVDAPEAADVAAFSCWMDQHLRAGDLAALLAYRRLAPHAAREHPSEEHLLPLFVALGAAGEHPTVERLHTSVEYGILRMDCYAFS